MTIPPETRRSLRERMQTCLPHAVALDGVGFRSVGMKYATEGDLLSGHGAGYYGGRWNPPGLRAVYASSSPVTAVKEAYQVFLNHGIAAVHIRLRDILGERWAEAQRQGGGAWSQQAGRCAFELGFEGLLAPSVQDRDGRNLVLFPDALLPGSSLAVVAAEDLPQHPPSM